MANKGEITKGEIIKAAAALFFEKGFHRISFQMIAKEISLTQPALYSYFANKEEILLAVANKSVLEGRAFIDQSIDEQASAKERLKGYIVGNIKWVLEKREEASSLLAVYYFGASNEKIKNFHFLINEGGTKRIETLIIHGNRERSWAVRQPLIIARSVHDLLSGEMIKAFHWPNETALDKRIKNLWTSVEKLTEK